MDSKYDIKRAGLTKFNGGFNGVKSYKPLQLSKKSLKKNIAATNGSLQNGNGKAHKMDLQKAPSILQPVNKVALIHESSKKNLFEQRKQLPVYKFRNRIVKEIYDNECLILLGETGSGKTTQIPQFVHECGQLLKSGICAVTQPRRMAAISIAQRVAEEQHKGKVGELVGYVVRFEDVTSDKTKIQYMTDGSLLRQALNDRLLTKYSVIILDEAHERTINTDVLFGLCKSAQATRKQKGLPPLRIVVMSATMDVDHFSQYFNNCNVIYLEGRLFPVQVLHAKKNNHNMDYQEVCLFTLFNIHTTTPLSEDVLIFLTGQEEIEALMGTIKDILKNDQFKNFPMKIFPLYAQLPQAKQMIVFKPTPNARKVILSTNIAETSITIRGIKHVIDSGVVKRKTFNPSNRVESLKVTKISQAQAWQRTGRAGRESSGTCYRVYPIAEFNKMLRMTVPEILNNNLSATVLQLLAMGIDCANFDFMDQPDPELVDNAFKLLHDVKAIDGLETRQLTDSGRQMAKFPLEPRLSRALLASVELGCVDDVLTIVALLSADNVFLHSTDNLDKLVAAHRKFQSSYGDLITLLNVYQAFKAANDVKTFCFINFLNQRNLSYAAEVRNQLEATCRKCKLIAGNGSNTKSNDNKGTSPTSITNNNNNSKDLDYVNVRKCLLIGFYDNVAQLQKDNTYMTLSSHQRAKIHPSSVVNGKERPELLFYTEFLSTGQNYLKQNTLVEAKWLLEMPQLKKHFRNFLQK